MSASQCMMVARSQDFQDRVKYYLQKASLAVMAESDQTANHADRIVYAHQVLSGQTSIYEVAIGVTTNATVAANVAADIQTTDGDLEYCVISMFDAFSG